MVPRAFPDYGASTVHINRLRKLQRQLGELRFIHCHHHLDAGDVPLHLQYRIECTWGAARLLCHRLRPNALLAYPDVWTVTASPPRGEHLDNLIHDIEKELARRTSRAKAERIKIWADGVREPTGRKAALYARAADNSPTAYLRTAAASDNAYIHCDQHAFDPDDVSTDASDDEAHAGGFSPSEGAPSGSDTDHGDDNDPPVAHVPDATPANSIIANTKDMLKLMVDTWEPILGRYRARAGHGDGEHTEAMPTWADFYAEYRQELPTPSPAEPFVLTDDQLIHFIRTRPARRAGGLDGWTTREAKELPDDILRLYATVLRAMQRTGHIPEPFLHVPNSCLRKGRGELPTDQRLLSVLSVWMYAWESPAYRSLSSWRKGWTHATSFGAVPKATIGDVSTSLALRVEHARALALPLAGAALDRQKCFDYLITDICLRLALHAGCPRDIVRVRRNFYRNISVLAISL